MVFIVIFITIAAVGAALLGYRGTEDMGSAGLCGFMGLFLGSVISCLIVALATNADGPKSYKVVEVTSISALQDNNGIAGQKFLFSGTIKDQLQYRYVFEDEVGLRIGEVPSDNSVIIYDDESPRMERYDVYFKDPVHRFFALHETEYRFYVPEGTVATEYSVDLK